MQLTETLKFDLCNLEEMANELKECIKNSKSYNTRRAYSADWKYFVDWCNERGLAFLPSSPHTIGLYLVSLSKTHKAATLDRKLLSIKQAHNYARYPLDKNDTTIRDAMKGIKNMIGTSQVRKSPVLTEDLKQMVSVYDESLIGKRNRAILLIGFGGAFRRSEIVSLRMEDFHFNKNGIEITLRKSKTDQQGKGEIIPISYGSTLETCPVRSFKDWIESAGITSGYVFPSITKGGRVNQKPLSGTFIAMIIKDNNHVKNSDGDFSGHSLRAGFCTQAAMNNLPMQACMKHARQKKIETHMKYVRIANIWTDCPSAKLGL